MTEKEARKSLREMKKAYDGRTLVFENPDGLEIKVRYLLYGYAILIGEDDSDVYTDYCAWSFGHREKDILMRLRISRIID